MGQLKLYNEQHVKSKFVNQPGLFETATVVGAFFLIKTDVFRKIGFFNEKFFFCPEDVEVGIKLRKCGYKCYVDSNVYIYHLDGGTFKVSKLRVATMPAATKGELLLYGSNYLKKIVLILLFKTISFIKYIYWKKKVQEKWDAAYIMAMSHKHVIETIGSDLTTKEIFVKFYKEIKK